MSKGNSYWSTARGKIGDIVISINKGQRIERAYQPVVNNPKTTKQMTQRAIFANQVKFYKHAVANFFKFAFEDKRQTESDYNAFVRNNRGVGMISTRSQYLDSNYPALGNRYMLSKGSLMEADKEGLIDNDKMFAITLLDNVVDNEEPTIGDVSTSLINKYSLQQDDIVTIVFIGASIEDLDDEPSVPPIWRNIQFKVDESNTAKMTTLDNCAGAEIIAKTGSNPAELLITPIGYAPDYVQGMAFIFSRNTTNGLLVNDSYVYLNTKGENVYNDSLQESYRAAALTTWGASGEAILEGSLVK